MKRKNLNRLIIPAAVFAVCLVISGIVLRNTWNNFMEDRQTTAASIAQSRSKLFQQLLDERVSTTGTLTALVFESQGMPDHIDITAQELFRQHSPMITAAAIAKDGIISYSYPDQSFTVGDNLFQRSSLSKLLAYTRDSQRTAICFEKNTDNSIDIILYRPIYLREEGTGYQTFWGFAIVRCPYETMLEDARIRELSQDGYSYRLVMHSSFGNSDSVIASDGNNADYEDAASYTFDEPGYTFTLQIIPSSGWNVTNELILPSALLLAVTMLVTALVASLQNMMEVNHQLDLLSSRDALTSLPNIRSFKAQVDQLIRQDQPFTIFFMDANHFKHVNDTYGHQTGNEILREYAFRIADAYAQNAFRLGGDEFSAIVPGHLKDDEAEAYISKMNDIMKVPVKKDSCTIELSVSSGWSVYEHGKTYDAMLEEADARMYKQKETWHSEHQKEER